MVERRNQEVPGTYRDTTLGLALDQSLRELLNAGEIDQKTMDTILHQFDYSMLVAF